MLELILLPAVVIVCSVIANLLLLRFAWIPLLLRRLGIQRNTNNQGEVLLQVPPRKFIEEEFFVHLVWNSKNRQRVEELRGIYGDDATDLVPKKAHRKWLTVKVYNLVISTDKLGKEGGSSGNQKAGGNGHSSKGEAPFYQKSMLRRLVSYLVGLGVNISIYLAVDLIRKVDFTISDVKILRSGKRPLRVQADEVFFCGYKHRLTSTNLHLGMGSLQATVENAIGKLAVVGKIDKGICLSVHIPVRARTLVLGQWLGVKDDIITKMAAPHVAIDFLGQTVLEMKHIMADGRPGTNEALLPIPTYEQEFNVLPEVSTQMAISAAEISGQLLNSDRERGVLLEVSDPLAFFANVSGELESSKHFIVNLGNFKLRSVQHDVDERVCGVLCSNDSESAHYKDATEWIIEREPEFFLESRGLGLSMSNFADCRAVKIFTDGLFLASEPKGNAEVIAAVRDYVQGRISEDCGNDLGESESNVSVVAPKSPKSLGIRVDLKNSSIFLVNKEVKGFAETRAFALSFSSTAGTVFEKTATGPLNGSLRLLELKNIHFPNGPFTKNIISEEFGFDLTPESVEMKWAFRLKGTRVRWDPDWQDFFDNAKAIVQPLLDLRPRKTGVKKPVVKSDGARTSRVNGEGSPIHPQEASKPQFSFRNDVRFYVDDLFVEVQFPDGPQAAVHVGFGNDFCLNDLYFSGRDLYWIVLNKRVAYAKEWKMGNFNIMFKWPVKTVDLSLWQTRFFMPVHDYHYGNRWGDFWIRLRGYLRSRRELRNPGFVPRQKQFPDLKINGWDVEVELHDHPLNGFLLRRLPLWRDEAIQRNERRMAFDERIYELPSRAQDEAFAELMKLNSASYIRRVKALMEKEEATKVRSAPHYPYVVNPPVATLEVGMIQFNMFSDEAVQKYGTEEHVRRFLRMDTCKLEAREKQKSDPRNWNELGFRTLKSAWEGVSLKLRNYPTAILHADSLLLNGLVGVGKQHVTKPFVTRARVGLGVKLAADVQLPITPMKMFLDLEISSRTMQVSWNQAYMAALIDFTKNVSKFVGEGKEISPRIMSFDMMRANHHARIQFKVHKLVARVGAGISPYARIDHYVDIAAAPLELKLSRFGDQQFPLMVQFRNLAITPRTFSKDHHSRIQLKSVSVNLSMTYFNRNPDRNSQDHYLHPFPEKEEDIVLPAYKFVRIEKTMSKDDTWPRKLAGEMTQWKAEIGETPGWDTWREWRSKAVDVLLTASIMQKRYRGGRSRSSNTWNDRISDPMQLTSDGITTLLKTARIFTTGGPAVKANPGWKEDKYIYRPLPRESLGDVMRTISVDVSIAGIHMKLLNNIRPGNSMYVRIDNAMFNQVSEKSRLSVSGERELMKRAATVDNLEVRQAIPNMDIGGTGPNGDEGFFVCAEAITFNTIPGNADVLRSVDDSLKSIKTFSSPFRGISAGDGRQKGRKIEEAESKNKVSVRSLKLFISPDRRDAIIHWRMALREKTFPLKKHLRSQPKGDTRPVVDKAEQLRRRERDILEQIKRTASDEIRTFTESNLTEGKSSEGENDSDSVLEFRPVFHMIVENTQTMFCSPDTKGTIILRTSPMEVKFNRKTKASEMSENGVMDESEWNVQANNTELFSLTEDIIRDKYGELWVPEDENCDDINEHTVFSPMTGEPLTLNILFVSQPSSGNIETERVRPSTLYINVPKFSLDTTSDQFEIFRRVIDMLNKRLPLATDIQHELAALRYQLLRNIGSIDKCDLDYHAIHLKTICHQIEYAMETGQLDLVKSLLKNDEDVQHCRKLFLAKSKAFNTFIHKQHYKDNLVSTGDSNEMYPSMFFSCSFDKIVWTLRESSTRDQLAELEIANPVFNRVAYVGRGSSLEFTFTNINVVNRMRGAMYKEVLALNKEDSGDGNDILSTDSRNVAFKWFHMIVEPVGEINVYDHLTIKLAPLRANLSTKLLKAIKEFIIPPSQQGGAMTEEMKESQESISVRGSPASSRNETELQIMRARARTSNFFKYIYIGEVRLVASIRLGEESRGRIAEYFSAVQNLVIKDHSHMYSSKLWSWDDFLGEIRRLLSKLKSRAINHVIRDKLRVGIMIRDRMRLQTRGRGRVQTPRSSFEDDEDRTVVSLPSKVFESMSTEPQVTFGDEFESSMLPGQMSITSDEFFKQMMFSDAARTESKMTSEPEEDARDSSEPQSSRFLSTFRANTFGSFSRSFANSSSRMDSDL